VVIKFDKYDWTLDAKVVRIIVAIPSNPAKVGLFEVLLDLLELDFPRFVGVIQQKLIADVQDELLLRRCEVRD
jgi:hypothetical protein